MSEKLKPCPFCGSSHVLAEDFEEFDMGMYWIRCGDCGAGCSTKDTTEEAIKAWNRRAEPKRGEWIAYKGMQMPERHGLHYCSNCNHSLHLASNGRVYNYCPRCGAKMEVEE
jgi:Lar family restriction alleviation protein